MISFGAKYISTAIAQKIDRKTDAITPCEVSFVELNPNNSDDCFAVGVASESWGEPDCSEEIYKRMDKMSKRDKGCCSNTEKFYAIVANNKYFNILEPSNILALCKIHLDDDVKINYLQVKPDNSGLFKKTFNYNHIGTAMLDSIKKLYQDKNIKLFTLPSAKKFYLANGFKECEAIPTKLCYEA